MSPIIDNSCESLLAKLSEHVNKKESFDIWKYVCAYKHYHSFSIIIIIIDCMDCLQWRLY